MLRASAWRKRLCPASSSTALAGAATLPTATAKARLGNEVSLDRNLIIDFGKTPSLMNVHPTAIHPTAIIDPRAKVPASCEVGPYCVIGTDVELGENCRLVSHVAIEGPTKIGSDNGFFPFCAIGMAPQDTSYAGEPTRLEIGDHNEIRESVTISRGTVKAAG